jgi:hypothetical protein
MTATKTIPDLLGLTKPEYEKMYVEAYLRYCMDFSYNYQNDLQKLVSNSALNAWYNMEYAKCENEFLITISGYENATQVTADNLQKVYNECTYRMFNLRCKVLIDNAKNTNVYAN